VNRARYIGFAVSLCAFAAAAPANAAFFPDLDVEFAPANAHTAPGLSATFTQPQTDTAIERFTLSLPAEFGALKARGVEACGLAAVRAAACPPATRLGAVDGRVGTQTAFSGTIHKVTHNRFAVSVSALGGAIRQVVPGSITRRANGSLDLKLDQLPALALTRLTFRFYGGGAALIRTPSKCGDYTVDGKFTSRRGELALDRSVVAITGCRGVPAVRVSNVRLTRTIIAWWAARWVEHTDVRIERRTKRGWRRVGTLVTGGVLGDNRLRWDGRVNGRVLRPGAYGLRIQPAGSAPSERVSFRIR
jgi:hypothetical protein